MNIADMLYVGCFTESQLFFVDAAVFTDFQSVPEPNEWEKNLQSTTLVFKAKLINSAQTHKAGFQAHKQMKKSQKSLQRSHINVLMKPFNYLITTP